jgi:hypothetical protein
MKQLSYLLVWVSVLCGACSYILPAKKVECCEQAAACCHEQVCCLPRYARAAGKDPKAFTTDIPTYGTAQDLEPTEGETIVKLGLLARWNPFGSAGSEPEKTPEPKTEEQAEKTDEEGGLLDWLWPF